MQYKSEMEKIQMIEDSNMPPPYPIVLNNNPQIRRTRQHLIIILSICLILSLASAIIPTSTNLNAGVGAVIAECIASVALYGFGLICAHRYSSLGLRIFAWINVIGLIIVLIGVAVLVLGALAGFTLVATESEPSLRQAVAVGSIFILIVAIAAAIGSILTIIIVIFSFKLARLINAN